MPRTPGCVPLEGGLRVQGYPPPSSSPQPRRASSPRPACHFNASVRASSISVRSATGVGVTTTSCRRYGCVDQAQATNSSQNTANQPTPTATPRRRGCAYPALSAQISAARPPRSGPTMNPPSGVVTTAATTRDTGLSRTPCSRAASESGREGLGRPWVLGRIGVGGFVLAGGARPSPNRQCCDGKAQHEQPRIHAPDRRKGRSRTSQAE